MADTKKKFLDAYNKPIPGIYSTVVNELLVQQHLIRYNRKYQYNSVRRLHVSQPSMQSTQRAHHQVFALGFVSVYEQIGEGLEAAERDAIFTAYIKALDESPDTYRKDAAALEEWAKSLDSAESVAPNADGDIGQKALAAVASQVADGKFAYSKFFAIGLFRLLELTGAKDPKALGSLVTALGVRQDMVNRDLLTYKGVLSKLSAAKELQEVCEGCGGMMTSTTRRIWLCVMSMLLWLLQHDNDGDPPFFNTSGVSGA